MSGLILSALLAFCAFGFAATFEPMDRSSQILSRLIYLLLAGAVIFGLSRVFRWKR